MSTVVNLFPTFTEERRNKLKYNFSDYSFFYNDDNCENKLLSEDAEGDGKTLSLSDELGYWKPDLYNFGLLRQYDISNLNSLFGTSGIVCRNAVLGIALMWTSQESKQRGSLEIGVFDYETDSIKYSVKHCFMNGQFRGKVQFETILFIKEKGMGEDDNTFRKYQEIHRQRGYTLEEMKRFAKEAGLTWIAEMDSDTMGPAADDSERILCVVRENGKTLPHFMR